MTNEFGKMVAALLVAGTTWLAIAPAEAAVITRQIDFTASGFGAAAPVDTVSGSFTLSLDPAVASTGAVANFLSNLPALYMNDIRFGYLPNAAPGIGYVTIGQTVGIGGVTTPAGSGVTGIAFSFAIDSAFATALSGGDAFVFGTPGTQYQTTRATFSAQSVPGAVPEPATWALMIAGFAVTGAALRRHPTRARVDRSRPAR